MVCDKSLRHREGQALRARIEATADLRHSLAIAALSVCVVVLLRFCGRMLAPAVEDTSYRGAYRLHVACWDGANETLLCIDDVPAHALVPLRPEAWAFGAIGTSDCAARPLAPSARICPGGMSQSMRLMLGAPVELDSCDADVLALVSGMTPKLARGVVRARQRDGSIPTYRALLAVEGMGQGRLRLLAAASVLAPETGEGPRVCATQVPPPERR